MPAVATAITAKAQAIQQAEWARNELASTQAEAAKKIAKSGRRGEVVSDQGARRGGRQSDTAEFVEYAAIGIYGALKAIGR